MKSIRASLAALALAFCFAVTVAPVSAQSLGDTTENGILAGLKGGTAYAWPATVYVALSTAACSDSSVGTEVSGGSYARVAVTSNTFWTGPSSGNGLITSAAAATFPAPTGNWGTVTHWTVMDASSSGNVLLCNALTASRTINSGDGAPSFASGSITITISKAPLDYGQMIAANDPVYAIRRRVA